MKQSNHELLILAIDLGVTNLKIGVYDKQGNCKGSARLATSCEQPETGITIHHSEDYLSGIIRGLKQLSGNYPVDLYGVEAVCISGMMGAAIGVDGDWNDITTLSTNLDTRYSPQVREMQKLNASGMARFSGTTFPAWGAKLLWWKKEFPELYRRVEKFMFLGGYIIGRLAGHTPAEALTDNTYLEQTGLADTLAGEWSGELVSGFSLDMKKLPRICRPTDIAGHLSSEMAGKTGLRSGIPIVAGGGDKPVGALGAGITRPGMILNESASFGAFTVCTDRFDTDTFCGMSELVPSPLPGLYYPTFGLMGSGLSLAWMATLFSGDRKDANRLLETLEVKAAMLPPGSEGLMAIGLLEGRPYPVYPEIRGLWIGHTLHHRQEHFYRAMLESYAYEYRFFYDKVKSVVKSPDASVTVIGGGAGCSLWNQIKSDVLGLEYRCLNRDDATLLGNVLIAGSAIGIYDDLKTAGRAFIRTERSFRPDPDLYKTYGKLYDTYIELIESNRKIFQDLSS